MYSPIVNNDTGEVAALYQLYRKAYRYIGMIILIAGLIVIPMLTHLINDYQLLNINVYVPYLLTLTAVVLSYLSTTIRESKAVQERIKPLSGAKTIVVSEFMVYAALLHYGICCISRLNLTVYSKTSIVNWAEPYVVISFAVTNKGTIVFLQYLSDLFLVFSH